MVATNFSQIGNLPDIGALVDQAAYMDGQLAAVHIICLVAQEIEKLGVDHAIIRKLKVLSVSDMMRNSAVFLSPSVSSCQFIVHREITQLLDVEGG